MAKTKTESAWVVSNGKFCVGTSGGTFTQTTPNTENALRFSRKIDAENFIMSMYMLGQAYIKTFKAEEHVWA